MKRNFSSDTKTPAGGADVFSTIRKWLLFQRKTVIPPDVVFRGFHYYSLKSQLQRWLILFLNEFKLFFCFTCTKNPCSMVGVDLQWPMTCDENSNSTSCLAPRCAGDLTAETITCCERVINMRDVWNIWICLESSKNPDFSTGGVGEELPCRVFDDVWGWVVCETIQLHCR